MDSGSGHYFLVKSYHGIYVRYYYPLLKNVSRNTYKEYITEEK